MSNKNKKYKGFFFAELVVAFAVLGTLMVGLALSLHSIAKFNRFQLVRQQCVAAAEAQLDSISVTGEQVPEEEFKKLWPKIDINIEQSEGAGQWEGMKLIRAKTSGMSFDAHVNVELSRYIQTPTQAKEQ